MLLVTITSATNHLVHAGLEFQQTDGKQCASDNNDPRRPFTTRLCQTYQKPQRRGQGKTERDYQKEHLQQKGRQPWLVAIFISGSGRRGDTLFAQASLRGWRRVVI